MAKRKKTSSSDTKPPSEELFPAFFPIKIFGMATDEFEITVLSIIRKHVPDLKENAIQHRPSKGGKYLAMTVTLWVENREQLDAIYQELTKNPQVLMAL